MVLGYGCLLWGLQVHTNSVVIIKLSTCTSDNYVTQGNKMNIKNVKSTSLHRAGSVLLFVLVIAGFTYGCFRLQGLSRRVTTVENRVNDIESAGGFTYDADEGLAETEVDVTVLSQEIKELRIQEGFSSTGDPHYVTKPTVVLAVKIKNITDGVYDLTSSDIRVQTDKGLLLA